MAKTENKRDPNPLVPDLGQIMARFTQNDLVDLRQQSALHIPVMPIKRPFDYMRAWLHQPSAL